MEDFITRLESKVLAAIETIQTLRQENERLKEENEILKKAAKYFARESE